MISLFTKSNISQIIDSCFEDPLRERPYQHDSTTSRLLCEVKHVRARLVLRWGTTLESRVLFSFAFFWREYVLMSRLLHGSGYYTTRHLTVSIHVQNRLNWMKTASRRSQVADRS
jgi:hypothetical protein